jgi:hypothetical protein
MLSSIGIPGMIITVVVLIGLILLIRALFKKKQY